MKAVKFFGSKDKARAWVARCKRDVKGVIGGSVYTLSSSSNFHAMIYGDFNEADVRATCAPNCTSLKFEKDS